MTPFLTGVTFSVPATPLVRDGLHQQPSPMGAAVLRLISASGYNELSDRNLTAAGKTDLVEFLKSL